MSSQLVLKTLAVTIPAYFVEKTILTDYAPALATTAEIQVPKAFALVLVVNVFGSFVTVMMLGMKVGQARKQYGIEYPTMYATGTSKDAQIFNCIQRGHQQALETYASFLVFSVVAGVKHPLLTALAGLLWSLGRWQWAAGYSTGDPSERYKGTWTRCIWYSLLVVAFLSLSTGFSLAGLDSLFLATMSEPLKAASQAIDDAMDAIVV